MSLLKSIKESNTLRQWLIAIGLIVLGLMLLSLAESERVKAVGFMQHVVRSVGTTVLGVAVVSVVWDLNAKRRFANELFAIADVASSIQESGVQKIDRQFHDLPWKRLFKESKIASIFITYGRTWRNTNRSLLTAFVAAKGKQLNIFLPDYNDEKVVGELASRYSMDSAELSKRIKEAVVEFRSFAADAGGAANQRMKVYLVKGIAPTATYYVFDNTAIMTTYCHCPEKKPVPVLQVGKPGTLYDYIAEEIEAVKNASSEAPQIGNNEVGLLSAGGKS